MSKERMVYPRINGSQAVQDDLGAWYLRYRNASTGVYSKWAPWSSLGRPSGLAKKGKLLAVTLPSDKKESSHVS